MRVTYTLPSTLITSWQQNKIVPYSVNHKTPNKLIFLNSNRIEFLFKSSWNYSLKKLKCYLMVCFGFLPLRLSPLSFVSRRVSCNEKVTLVQVTSRFLCNHITHQACWSCRRLGCSILRRWSSTSRSIGSGSNVWLGIGRFLPRRCKGISLDELERQPFWFFLI